MMESAASTLTNSHQLHHHHQQPQSPFDPYRDPFDNSTRTDQEHDPANDDVPESWSSGGNNSDRSPLPLNTHHTHQNGTNGTNGATMIVDMMGIKQEGGYKQPEPKKKRFVCPHCTRTFARSGHLQRHERSRMLSLELC